jgi:signal transduction histidine kinase
MTRREETQAERRKRFGRFTAEDALLLADLRPVLERNAAAIVEAFYDHLLQFAELRPFLSPPGVVERLKTAQRGYLLSLVSGVYDEAYAESRIAIGRLHERIGLEPQWYLGTYGLYLDLLLPHVVERFGADGDRASRATAALMKRMILDMQLVLDAYHEARQRKAVERSEHLAVMGEMAASVAHEVRNPLAGIKGAIEVLRGELSAKDETRQIVDEVLGQITRLEGLVRDLLSYASPASGRREAVDVHDLLDRLLRFYRDTLDGADVVVERTYGVGTSAVAGDPGELEQVFMNLIQNAIQSMDGTGGKLTLATAASDGRLTISFRDTGRGVPAHVLPHVFQPFYTTKHRGSGLGLSIVKRIVEQHGGTIELRSAEGRGTAATLTLPVAGRD